jgi:Fe-S oxidoreductase
MRTVLTAVVLVATVVGVSVFVRGVLVIYRTVSAGRPAPGRTTPAGTRLARVLGEVLGHARFRHRPVVRAAHWFVMLSFPLLVITLVGAYGQVGDPRYSLPVLGHLPPVEWTVETFAWLATLAITALVVIRLREHPGRLGRASRFSGSTFWQAYYVEATVAVVGACIIALRAAEFALLARDPSLAHLATAWHFPLTAWLGSILSGASTAGLENAIVLLSVAKILVSMAWFVTVGLQPAMGVAWHRFLAVVTIFTRRDADGGPALGALPPLLIAGEPVDLTALDSLPDDARLGLGTVEDLTWRNLLDVSTCTECGRCQNVCPAWATGKPLSPKQLLLEVRDHAYDRTADRTEALVGGIVDPEELWACTMCGACVQECPVDIEHLDLISGLRRHQVLMANEVPTELAGTLAKLEQRGNPWGLPARNRMDWAKGLPFEVPVVGVDVDTAAELDYLFWVGCAGAYDDKARATTRAVAELLHRAGVTFAVLGNAETCTGDPARRAGNEFLFQLLASQNIEALDAAKPQAIVATCAHCLNSLSNEYPQLGGTYTVVHHTELLARLVAEGRLTLAGASATRGSTPGQSPEGSPGQSPDRVTYHDPCYLGRHNQVYSPPRELLAAIPGLEVAEMPRSCESSFCCGGGGARAFMNETTGTRISSTRAEEAIATGAGTIATACPFCTTMLTDGVAGSASGSSTPVLVTDVAQLVLSAVRRGDPEPPTPS